jgi:hypothetical protein
LSIRRGIVFIGFLYTCSDVQAYQLPLLGQPQDMYMYHMNDLYMEGTLGWYGRYLQGEGVAGCGSRYCCRMTERSLPLKMVGSYLNNERRVPCPIAFCIQVTYLQHQRECRRPFFSRFDPIHRGSTAGQNIRCFLPTLSSKIPSSHAAHRVPPSSLIAKPAVRTPTSLPVAPPVRTRRDNAS